MVPGILCVFKDFPLEVSPLFRQIIAGAYTLRAVPASMEMDQGCLESVDQALPETTYQVQYN